MPGKHVHWDNRVDDSPYTANAYFSPSSTSSSSLPSSSPSSSGSSSHYGTSIVPLPDVQTKLNPILAYHSRPSLTFDLTLHSSLATTASGNPLTPTALSEPATYPALRTITISSRALPWSIVIIPSSSKPSAVVTVGDVLNGIYVALRQPLAPEELGVLSKETQTRVTDAYQRRYRRMEGNQRAYEEEKLKGRKRVDVLMKKKMWMGLAAGARDDVLELVVA